MPHAARPSRLAARRFLLFLALPALSAPGCRRAGPHRPAAAASSAASAASAALEPTAIAPADGNSFAVIGDFGLAGPGEARVAALLERWHPDFIVTTGDNNYPHGADATFEANVAQYFAPFIAFGPRYQGRFRAAGRAAGDQRFWPVLGNHDWHVAGARDSLGQYALPGNGRYYTLRRGPVQLFLLDSDRREPDGVDANSAQARWLKAAMQASDAPLKVVAFHHPPYSLGYHGSAAWMRWPFAEWGASVVLSGHNHDYERHHVGGIPYVVNGIGGADLHQLTGACTLAGSEFSVCTSNVYGAMRASLAEDEPTALEFVGVAADGREFDRFRVRPRAGKQAVAPLPAR